MLNTFIRGDNSDFCVDLLKKLQTSCMVLDPPWCLQAAALVCSLTSSRLTCVFSNSSLVSSSRTLASWRVTRDFSTMDCSWNSSWLWSTCIWAQAEQITVLCMDDRRTCARGHSEDETKVCFIRHDHLRAQNTHLLFYIWTFHASAERREWAEQRLTNAPCGHITSSPDIHQQQLSSCVMWIFAINLNLHYKHYKNLKAGAETWACPVRGEQKQGSSTYFRMVDILSHPEPGKLKTQTSGFISADVKHFKSGSEYLTLGDFQSIWYQSWCIQPLPSENDFILK